MYLLKRFCGDRFARINEIIDQYENLITSYVNLIASASYPFPEVVQAMGNPLQVLPSEGLPGKRYFPGAKPLDEIENDAECLILKLLDLPAGYRATIQPHSGTQANQVAFNSVLSPDDVVLSLRPSHGGHISHTVLVGRRNTVIHYRALSTGELDYEEIFSLAKSHRPKLIIAGASSLPRAIDFGKLGDIAQEVGAFLHADISHTSLFIMTKLHPSAFPYADFASFSLAKNLRGPNSAVLVYRDSLSKRVSSALFPGTQGGPNESMMLAKLVCCLMLSGTDLQTYALDIIQNARLLARVLQESGITIETGGTDSHIIMIDLRNLGLNGAEAEELMEKSYILANRNLILDDPRPPWVASGLRLGTACITALRYSSTDTQELGCILSEVLLSKKPANREQIASLLYKYKDFFSIANEVRD